MDNFLFRISEKKIAISLVIFAIIFNAVFLFSEVSIPTFHLNDEVYHQLATQEATISLKNGQDPTDFWLSQIELGYPLFHHYQHLPQLILAIINRFSSNFFPLSRLFDFSRYFLLVFFPLSIFLAMRKFGFDFLSAGFSALISSLISTNGLFGFEYESYIWRGFGLYPQLFAMFFLPLALAEIYCFLNKKGSLFLALLFSVFTLLSHLFYGYILLISAILFCFLSLKKEEIFPRLKNLIFFLFLLALLTSYFFIPLFLNRDFTNYSRWIPVWKWDSFGAKKVLFDLLTGQLFDFNRFPSLTLFFFGALILFFVLKLYREEKYRLLLVFTFFWLFLFFGRPTFGAFLKILPFSDFLQFHRLIGAFHLGAIMIIGIGLSVFFQKIKSFSFDKIFLFFVGLIFIVFLFPVYSERIKFCQENKIWRLQNQEAFLAEKEELSEIEKTLKNLPPGRVYAGLPATFGDYPYYKIGSVPIYSLFPQWGIDSFGYSYHSEALSADVRLHFDDSRPAQYNLFNIRYVLLHTTWTPPYYYSKIKEFENYILYELPTTGYFDLVDVPAVFYGKSSDFYYPNSKWLFSSLVELKQHPILELGNIPKKTFGLPVFPFPKVDENILNEFVQSQAERGKILDEKIEINRYFTNFLADRDCYLILKANYHPGFEVFLDNERVSPVMLAPGFIGIKVTPGIHQALFSYQFPWFRIPLLLFGIFILLISFFYSSKICLKWTIKKQTL